MKHATLGLLMACFTSAALAETHEFPVGIESRADGHHDVVLFSEGCVYRYSSEDDYATFVVMSLYITEAARKSVYEKPKSLESIGRLKVREWPAHRKLMQELTRRAIPTLSGASWIKSERVPTYSEYFLAVNATVNNQERLQNKVQLEARCKGGDKVKTMIGLSDRSVFHPFTDLLAQIPFAWPPKAVSRELRRIKPYFTKVKAK